jgi:mannose-1-phosphate guanylyltransferase/mannose-6-phosphate isomerase
MVIPVILSGGTGSRLWPLSREHYPKQFLPLVNKFTMLQNTVLRTHSIPEITNPILVCNEDHRFMVAEQMQQLEIKPSSIILEPVGRNTAPAVAIAALHALTVEENPLLLVLPADHVINDIKSFHSAINLVKPFAAAGKLVTFGIVPTSPETGYGYIKARNASNNVVGSQSVFDVDSFVEKPDLITAEGYLAAGDYYWNSGMFMFSAQQYLEELEKYDPEMVKVCREVYAEAVIDQDFVRLPKQIFLTCPSESIDYAVMEKTPNAVVAPLNAGWSDVGSWTSLWEIGEQDLNGNVLKGDVYLHDTRNCYISAGDRLVAAIGLSDIIIVETADAILVSGSDHVQDVKTIVKSLKDQNRREALFHRKVSRPWGSYQSVDNADRFQVKRITVNPGASLSLQMHHHRAEHWIVVKGTAKVVMGNQESILSENQSTYIPLGVTHRLENPGVIPLELIEVQSGSYLGEDDIVRFDDVYGRS